MAFPTILLLIYSAVHLSQNTLCRVHLLGAMLFFSSLINSQSSWEIRHDEHLFCDVGNSSPLSLLKNYGYSLVYVSTIDRYALSDRNYAFHLLIIMLNISNVLYLRDFTAEPVTLRAMCYVTFHLRQVAYTGTLRMSLREQGLVVLKHTRNEFLST